MKIQAAPSFSCGLSAPCLEPATSRRLQLYLERVQALMENVGRSLCPFSSHRIEETLAIRKQYPGDSRYTERKPSRRLCVDINQILPPTRDRKTVALFLQKRGGHGIAAGSDFYFQRKVAGVNPISGFFQATRM
ncbi:hypothetical protein KM043_005365 [Ampulex compressa]|nr:hypothetical protein KM043_005365 [Ampulex compressa]